jgi:aromatic-L-amino-acid decarboxylase
MNSDEFRKQAHDLVDFMADYLDDLSNTTKYPIKSQVKPKEIFNKLLNNPPNKPEPFSEIFSDFNNIIMPGITHWQSPNFHAYFQANNSRLSILAEMLTATIGAQCMIWDTSPAAAELEEKVMNWLRDMIGLPKDFVGVIQDTASTATIVSLITAREKITDYVINSTGLYLQTKFTVYCSEQAHSSIEKGMKIIGLGKENLRKVPVDEQFALIPEKLDEMIQKDIKGGFKPLAVVAAIGTTGSTAIDPLEKIGKICKKKYNIWLHVDAALVGSALILPEMRYMIEGIDYVDTFVFNPHKWLFTNFDASAYYVKDPETLIKTFEILPEYLKTKSKGVNNYRDWGIQLGRRFRALKIWFVIRGYGLEGLQEKIRFHLALTQKIVKKIQDSDEFELLAPVPVNTICFRFKPKNISDESLINSLNEQLLDKLNNSGKVYFTHTKLHDKYTIRFVIGQTEVQEKHIDFAWNLILKSCSELMQN